MKLNVRVMLAVVLYGSRNTTSDSSTALRLPPAWARGTNPRRPMPTQAIRNKPGMVITIASCGYYLPVLSTCQNIGKLDWIRSVTVVR